MHDFNDVRNSIDNRVATSPDLLGKECVTCLRILSYHFFKRDSSYRDGCRDQCDQCASAPRMSTEEHTLRLREASFSSHAVRKQRWDNQDDYMNDEARFGKRMHSSEFLSKLRSIIGYDKIF